MNKQYSEYFINKMSNLDYIDNPIEEEYCPSFLDSIQDLEEEMDFCDCIIDFPEPVFGFQEEELLYA